MMKETIQSQFNASLKALFTSIVMICSFSHIAAQSAIYAGGPAYYDTDFSIEELRSSGFTNLIVWTIHINESGDFNLNGEFLICKDGEYVGDQKYPEFPNTLAMFKTAPTSITRLEIGLSAWASTTFDNIKDLVEKEGTGESSVLYRNFKALKESIPVIDAVNFDDESTYDEASATKFAVMLADLGYKISLAPYTASSFWKELAENTNALRPGAVDAIYLQVYSGGANNNTCDWKALFGDIAFYSGLATNENSPLIIQSKMESWKRTCNIDGGFLWLYDDIKNSAQVATYAQAINQAFDFTVQPNSMAGNPVPIPNAKEMNTQVALTWSAGDKALSHNVYFGMTPDLALVGNQTELSYSPDNLQQGTKYYWRVDGVTENEVVEGPIWSFTTVYPIPEKVVISSPLDQALDVEASQSLNWIKEPYATSYNIYLSTSQNISAEDLLENTTKLSFKPEALNYSTTYYWRVDGVNATGTTTGDVWRFTTQDKPVGINGTSLSFDGDNDYVNCGNDASLKIMGDQITLEAWVKVNAFKANAFEGTIISKDYSRGSGEDQGYTLRCGGTGQFELVLGDGQWHVLSSPDNSIIAGAWVHIAASYDGAFMRLFLNGDEVASKAKSLSIADHINPVWIGKSVGFNDRVFNGKIDQVRIWNIALSSDDLKPMLNHELASKYLNNGANALVGYWSFDENEGQIVQDKSSFKNEAIMGTNILKDVKEPLWDIDGVKIDGDVSVGNLKMAKPTLEQNIPNPFKTSCMIKYSIPSAYHALNSQRVRISIYNCLGNKVKTLVNEKYVPGDHQVILNAEGMPTGVYFYVLEVGNNRFTKKMILN